MLTGGGATLQIDYRSFLDKLWEAMPASEYLAMISDPHVLGNPLLRTQHFIGGTRWEKVSDDEVIGYHQLRVPHQKYTDETMSEVAVKGHAYSANKHWYRRIDGVWKFAGLCPDIRFFEYDFDKVFADGRDQFGEEAAPAAKEEKTEEAKPADAAPEQPEAAPAAADVPAQAALGVPKAEETAAPAAAEESEEVKVAPGVPIAA